MTDLKKRETPYVTHDGYRWRVLSEVMLDDRPALDLERQIIVRAGAGHVVRRLRVVAFASDCGRWQPKVNGRRILRDGDKVLEFIPREGKAALVAVRLARGSKRWETSLDAIFSMTVKAHVALARAKKAAMRRARR